jgi:hypothetical protein
MRKIICTHLISGATAGAGAQHCRSAHRRRRPERRAAVQRCAACGHCRGIRTKRPAEAPPPLPETLETTASGDRFSAYRIRKPAVDLSR